MSAVAFACLGTCCALGQAKASASEAIAKLAKTNSLDDGDLRPWHLRVSFSDMDDAGKTSGQGTFEEWWAAPNRSRLEFVVAGQKAVTVHTPDGVFSTAGECSPA